MKTNILALVVFILATMPGCDRTKTPSTAALTPFTVTIDWVPSPEYYGLFYAASHGIYKEAHLDVTIQNGSGAPVVAKQLGVGSIYAGTTTSDNLLRQLAAGVPFGSATPLLTFSPCVIASLASAPVKTLADLNGKRLGTNQQSSVYQQLQYLIGKGTVKKDSFSEYPIGFGGAAQLKANEVDAILAYTTNAVVDLEKEHVPVNELYFGEQGIATYGLVLVVSDDARLAKAGLRHEVGRAFVRATLEGYRKGAADIEGAARALTQVEPTLNEERTRLAIGKIVRLNQRVRQDLRALDEWVVDPTITSKTREDARALYERE